MDNLSFKELVRKVHQNDEYFNIIVTKYFTEDLKLNEEEAKKAALALGPVQAQIAGKTVRKIIVVKNKIINVVV